MTVVSVGDIREEWVACHRLGHQENTYKQPNTHKQPKVLAKEECWASNPTRVVQNTEWENNPKYRVRKPVRDKGSDDSSSKQERER